MLRVVVLLKVYLRGNAVGWIGAKDGGLLIATQAFVGGYRRASIEVFSAGVLLLQFGTTGHTLHLEGG